MSDSLDTSEVRLVTVDVNGARRSLAVSAAAILLDTLRDDLTLTGTKEVCGMGNCGACTVLLEGDAVYSCLVLTAECDGASIETVESLADGDQLSSLQQAFVDCDALQCGFCTPGQLMSLEGLRRRTEAPTDREIEETVQGNLCRCGAYRHILEAARSALGTAAS